MSFYPAFDDATGGPVSTPSLTGFTLIFPAVSVGNVAQLAVDALIASYSSGKSPSLRKIGTYYDPSNVSSFVGVDAVASKRKQVVGDVTFGIEVFVDESRKLVIWQQRAPVLRGRKNAFVAGVVAWMRREKIADVILLTSEFAALRSDEQLRMALMMGSEDMTHKLAYFTNQSMFNARPSSTTTTTTTTGTPAPTMTPTNTPSSTTSTPPAVTRGSHHHDSKVLFHTIEQSGLPLAKPRSSAYVGTSFETVSETGGLGIVEAGMEGEALAQRTKAERDEESEVERDIITMGRGVTREFVLACSVSPTKRGKKTTTTTSAISSSSTSSSSDEGFEPIPVIGLVCMTEEGDNADDGVLLSSHTDRLIKKVRSPLGQQQGDDADRQEGKKDLLTSSSTSSVSGGDEVGKLENGGKNKGINKVPLAWNFVFGGDVSVEGLYT